VAKNYRPTGKVRILISIEIRILHVWTSADSHTPILPYCFMQAYYWFSRI